MVIYVTLINLTELECILLLLKRGQKVKYHLISITKSISKIFIPNFVCVLTIERYKTYQTDFLFYRLGHALGVGLGGT